MHVSYNEWSLTMIDSIFGLHTYERRVDHRIKDLFHYKWSLKQPLQKLEPDRNLLRVQTGACIQVNVSRMSLKLLRTQLHIVENLEITMAPLFLSLTS